MSNSASQTVSHSRTEQVHIVMPGDCNQYFRLFGGQLVQWIDTVAAVAARRHSGHAVTTASIDKLDFLASATLNDLVVLQGRLAIFAGRTSMLVAVDTFVEDKQCREHRLVNRATLTTGRFRRKQPPHRSAAPDPGNPGRDRRFAKKARHCTKPRRPHASHDRECYNAAWDERMI